MKGIWVDAGMAEFMKGEMEAGKSRNALGKFVSRLKGAQFTNPFYLAINNVSQMVAAGSVRSLKTPLYLARAIKKWSGRDAKGLEDALRNVVGKRIEYIPWTH